MHRLQRDRDILGNRALDRADIAQRDVQLLLVLPPRTVDAVHDLQQFPAHGRGRAKGDEQPVQAGFSSGA